MSLARQGARNYPQPQNNYWGAMQVDKNVAKNNAAMKADLDFWNNLENSDDEWSNVGPQKSQIAQNGTGAMQGGGVNGHSKIQKTKSINFARKPSSRGSTQRKNKNFDVYNGIYSSALGSVQSSVQTNALKSQVSWENGVQLQPSKSTFQPDKLIQKALKKDNGYQTNSERFKKNNKKKESQNSTKAVVTFRQEKTPYNQTQSLDQKTFYQTPSNDIRKQTALTSSQNVNSEEPTCEQTELMRKAKKKNRQMIGGEVAGDVMTSTDLSGNFFYKIGSVSYGTPAQNEGSQKKLESTKNLNSESNQKTVQSDQIHEESDSYNIRSMSQTQPTLHANDGKQPMNIMDESIFMNNSDLDGRTMTNHLQQYFERNKYSYVTNNHLFDGKKLSEQQLPAIPQQKKMSHQQPNDIDAFLNQPIHIPAQPKPDSQAMSYFSRVLGTEYSHPNNKIPTKTMKSSNSQAAMHADPSPYSTLSQPVNLVQGESTSALLAMQIPGGSQYHAANLSANRMQNMQYQQQLLRTDSPSNLPSMTAPPLVRKSKARILKKITWKRHATPDITAPPDRLNTGQPGQGPAGAGQSFPRSRSTFEIKRIRVQPGGQRQVLSVQRTLDEPKELSDYEESVRSLEFLKRNSSKQMSQLKEQIGRVRNQGDVREMASACDRALLPEYKRMSKTIRPGVLSKLFYHDNLIDFQIIESKSQSEIEKQMNVTRIFLDSVNQKINPQKKSKKFKVLKISKHSDGSVERQQHIIYKDYNRRMRQKEINKIDNFSSQSQSINRYYGSASAFKKVVEKGNHQFIQQNDGSVGLMERKRSSRFQYNKMQSEFVNIEELTRMNKQFNESQQSYHTLGGGGGNHYNTDTGGGFQHINRTLIRPNSVLEFGKRNNSNKEVMAKKMSMVENGTQQIQLTNNDSYSNDMLAYTDMYSTQSMPKQRPVINRLDLTKAIQYQNFQNRLQKHNSQQIIEKQVKKKDNKKLPNNANNSDNDQNQIKAIKKQPLLPPSKAKHKQQQQDYSQSVNNIELSRIDSSDAQDDEESIEESMEENEKTTTTNNTKVTADQNQVDFYASKIKKNDKKKPAANHNKNKIFDKQETPQTSANNHAKDGLVSKQKKKGSHNKSRSKTSQNTETKRQEQESKSEDSVAAPANVIDVKQEILDKFSEKKVCKIEEADYKKLYVLPKIDTKEYIQYLDQLLYGDPDEKKMAITSPVPPSVGQLKFQIIRDKSGFNKLAPRFLLSLEKKSGSSLLVLCARKMFMKKGTYFLITLEDKSIKSRKNFEIQDSGLVVGKLRSEEGVKNKFVLYNDGENYNQYRSKYNNLRIEHGTFIFKYVPCNVGNIRKIFALFPTIMKYDDEANKDKAHNKTNSTYKDSKDDTSTKKNTHKSKKSLDQSSQDNNTTNSKNIDFDQILKTKHQNSYCYNANRPTRDRETFLWQFENGAQQDAQSKQQYQIFVDKKPEFIPKDNVYAYDFHGRVLKASIKNFQLVPKNAQEPGEVSNDFTMQFGKRSDHEFILDLQFPHSIYQGFGLALSAFDLD